MYHCLTIKGANYLTSLSLLTHPRYREFFRLEGEDDNDHFFLTWKEFSGRWARLGPKVREALLSHLPSPKLVVEKVARATSPHHRRSERWKKRIEA